MVRYFCEMGPQEQDALVELALANPKNVRRRKIAKVLAGVMIPLMLLYLVVLAHRMSEQIIGLLFLAFFVGVVFRVPYELQKRILTRVQSKADNRLVSGRREYVFDEDGIKISSDLGTGEHRWNGFSCWGVFNNYVYVREIDNEMILVSRDRLSRADDEELLRLLREHLPEEVL